MFSLLFNRDYTIRTHCCAERASYTFFLLLDKCGRVALLIELIVRNSKTALGASINAQSAALTLVRVKSHFCHLVLFLLIGSIPNDHVACNCRRSTVNRVDQNIFSVNQAAAPRKAKAPLPPKPQPCASRAKALLRGKVPLYIRENPPPPRAWSPLRDWSC